jgi:hypothetical protein
MYSTRGLLTLLIIFSLSFISFIGLPLRHAIAQETNTALQRGYRTGYSDGYMAGYRDTLDNQTKDFSRHPDYASANRAFNKDYGTIEDYRDGYQQGFESGYSSGFDKKEFDSTVPAQLMLRGIKQPSTASSTTTSAPPAAATENNPPATTTNEQPATNQPTSAAPEQSANTQTTEPAAPTSVQNASFRSDDSIVTIAKDTELILELQDPLSTNKSKAGDKFTAKVVSPAELSGAVIEGRVSKIEKPGRIKRRSELALSFDRIVLTENRWGNFSGILTEVLPVKGDNVRRVDDEGSAVGKSSMKPDAIKVGASTGTGATVGAITGGPVGAAIGAGVGAAFGVGAVVIERGKDIRLNVNQQLRIKSAFDTQIR